MLYVTLIIIDDSRKWTVEMSHAEPVMWFIMYHMEKTRWKTGQKHEYPQKIQSEIYRILH